MKKKIALVTAGLFLMSSAALAAPLTDYTTGKASIDLNYRGTKNTLDDNNYDKKYNLEPSITYGVAEKWAIQYRNANAKSKHTAFANADASSKLTVNELNVLYSLKPNVSAFIGCVSTKAQRDANPSFYNYSETKNTWQIGVLGTVPLNEKFSAYAVLGAGGKWLNYEIGVSYAFTEEWEFNLDYRNMKAKFDNTDFKAKGFGFGVTYKFQ